MYTERLSSHASLEWGDPKDRAKQESETRPERIDRLRTMAQELFPAPEQAELRQEIERSFQVPQWGAHHNEGMLMDRHLEEILQALDAIREGSLPDDFPNQDRDMLTEIADRHYEALRRYVFLHDISKADLLRMEQLPVEGAKKGTAWEGSLEQWYEEEKVPVEARTDPALLYTYLAAARLKGISYYHQGMEMAAANRKTESAAHGEKGKEKIERMGIAGVSPSILEAIERHEVAFQFKGTKVDTYRKYFASLTDEERGLALVASLMDTMGSWGVEGQPDLRNFVTLLDSRANFELIERLRERLAEAMQSAGLEQGKVDAFLQKLQKTEGRILVAEDSLYQTALRECRPTEYDLEQLRSNLAELVQKGEITEDEQETLLDLVRKKDRRAINKTFGIKMKTLAPALKASEK